MDQIVKNLPEKQETWGWSLGWEDPLEEHVATHSSILAWRIPWTEEPGGLQSMGSHRVRHWVTNAHTHTEIKTKQTSFSHPLNPKTSKGMTVHLRVWRYDEEKRCHGAPFCWLLGGGGWLEQDSGWHSPWALLEARAVREALPSATSAPSEPAAWRMALVPVHTCTISRASTSLPASCPRALPRPWEFSEPVFKAARKCRI